MGDESGIVRYGKPLFHRSVNGGCTAGGPVITKFLVGIFSLIDRKYAVGLLILLAKIACKAPVEQIQVAMIGTSGIVPAQPVSLPGMLFKLFIQLSQLLVIP